MKNEKLFNYSLFPTIINDNYSNLFIVTNFKYFKKYDDAISIYVYFHKNSFVVILDVLTIGECKTIIQYFYQWK